VVQEDAVREGGGVEVLVRVFEGVEGVESGGVEGVVVEVGDLVETGEVYCGDKVGGWSDELFMGGGEIPVGEGIHDLLDRH